MQNPQFLKWQKDWVIPEINFSEKYPKEKILIYGDKKQGGNTQAFIQDESKVWDLLSGLNLKFISINRAYFDSCCHGFRAVFFLKRNERYGNHFYCAFFLFNTCLCYDFGPRSFRRYS